MNHAEDPAAGEHDSGVGGGGDDEAWLLKGGAA